jgi:pseudouridine kinase
MKVSVIGGINIDWMFHVEKKLMLNDSNPATHVVDFGGVGRNMAINFNLLKYDVTLYSVLPEDEMGKSLQKATRELGIQLHGVSVKQSPIYMSVFNEKGNMEVAVASMASMSELLVQHLIPYEQELLRSDCIVVDANVEPSIIDYISKLDHPFKVFEGVSTSKVIKLNLYLSGYHLVKVNALEKEALFPHLSDAEIQSMLSQNQQFIVTYGEKGACLMSASNIHCDVLTPLDVINASGAGDAFIVGAIHGILNNVSPLKMGHKMATCALLSPSSTPDQACILKEIL